jgi:hypothetical protein
MYQVCVGCLVLTQTAVLVLDMLQHLAQALVKTCHAFPCRLTGRCQQSRSGFWGQWMQAAAAADLKKPAQVSQLPAVVKGGKFSHFLWHHWKGGLGSMGGCGAASSQLHWRRGNRTAALLLRASQVGGAYLCTLPFTHCPQ